MKAIIPVACLGTRRIPATKEQSKEMLLFYNNSAIQNVMEEAIGS